MAVYLLLSSSPLFPCVSLAQDSFTSRETSSSTGGGEAMWRCSVPSSHVKKCGLHLVLVLLQPPVLAQIVQ